VLFLLNIPQVVILLVITAVFHQQLNSINSKAQVRAFHLSIDHAL
jgi:hypothetical protein